MWCEYLSGVVSRVVSSIVLPGHQELRPYYVNDFSSATSLWVLIFLHSHFPDRVASLFSLLTGVSVQNELRNNQSDQAVPYVLQYFTALLLTRACLLVNSRFEISVDEILTLRKKLNISIASELLVVQQVVKFELSLNWFKAGEICDSHTRDTDSFDGVSCVTIFDLSEMFIESDIAFLTYFKPSHIFTEQKRVYKYIFMQEIYLKMSISSQ